MHRLSLVLPLLALLTPVKGQLFPIGMRDTSIMDSAIQAEFDSYVRSMTSHQRDSLIQEVFSSSGLSSDSGMVYDLKYITLCDYIEMWPLAGEEDYVVNEVILCDRQISKGETRMIIPRRQESIVSEHGIFFSVRVALDPAFEIRFGDESEFRMISYGKGKFLVLQKHWITQHGGQTSYGLTRSYYLERLE